MPLIIVHPLFTISGASHSQLSLQARGSLETQDERLGLALRSLGKFVHRYKPVQPVNRFKFIY